MTHHVAPRVGVLRRVRVLSQRTPWLDKIVNRRERRLAAEYRARYGVESFSTDEVKQFLYADLPVRRIVVHRHM